MFADCSMSQLAVAWCLKNESVNCLLLGATSVEHFKENIHALQVIPWTIDLDTVTPSNLLCNNVFFFLDCSTTDTVSDDRY